MALYLLSPIELLPDTLPVLGLVDDPMLLPMAPALIVQRLPAALRSDFPRRHG